MSRRTPRRLLGAAFTLIVTATLVLTGTGTSAADVSPMIIGGDPATEEYPFAASLQYKDPGTRPTPHRCGGAVVHPEWVLTAAHCVAGQSPADFEVSVGANDYAGGTVFQIADFVVHPLFGAGLTSEGDIALIRLMKETTVPPIGPARSDGPGQPVRMIGWGFTVDGDPASIPRELRQLDTTLLPYEDCLWGDEFEISPGDLCVALGNGGTAGACNGDSGSPLLAATESGWKMLGVTSRGGGETGCLNTPEVYTSTATYWSWVRVTIVHPPSR